jgi:hypothetical protein
MAHQRRRRDTRTLLEMLLLAAAYGGMLQYRRPLTTGDLLDGALGVMLGLYICSQPAANAVDLLFFSRGGPRQLPAGWAGAGWLGLNLLVVFVGWLVIVLGATRLVGPAG